MSRGNPNFTVRKVDFAILSFTKNKLCLSNFFKKLFKISKNFTKFKNDKINLVEKELHQQLIKQLLTLATAGFGLVAALAWNDAIQFIFRNYLDPVLKDTSGGVVSRLIYAVIVTIIAVFVTYNLSKISGRVRSGEKKS